jgi:class 3 adenylate cyclase/tetratricopeptide (TPR) repeat protein
MSPEQTGDGPRIDNPANLSLSAEEKDILKEMFDRYKRVTLLDEFIAGMGGGRVFLVRPLKSEQSPDLPAVAKIAPGAMIEREWKAYQKYVLEKLPDVAAIIGDPVLLDSNPWGGLRYTLVGSGGTFEIQSLHYYSRGANIADILYVLEYRLFEVIGQNWWQFGTAEAAWSVRAIYDFLFPVNLLIEPASPPDNISPHLIQPNALPHQSVPLDAYVRLEGFVVTEVDLKQKSVTLDAPSQESDPPMSYRLRLQPVEFIEHYQVDEKIKPVTGQVRETRHGQLQGFAQDALQHRIDLTSDTLTASDGTVVPNPLKALDDLRDKTRNVKVSRIHGDLNMENILVEPVNRSVSLIDFATARRDYTLHDMLRLETEVVLKLIPEALRGVKLLVKTIDTFYKRLHKVASAPRSPVSTKPHKAELEKPFDVLMSIRQVASRYLFHPNDWAEYYEGLTLYTLGALKFRSMDPLSREVAFWTAAVAYNFIKPVPQASVLVNKEWSRLQKYLPAEMCQEEQEADCLKHLNALLRTALTYLPRHLALDLLRKPVVAQNKGQFLEGTLLFADISGFTAMSEKLRKKDAREGAEEITRVINAYLDVMLPILFKYDGRLIKLGGDAMLCLFTGKSQGAMKAVWAAWEMKKAMTKHFAKIEVLQEIYPLEMKVGSNSGQLFAVHVGTKERMEYVLTGSAVEHVARVESAASKGDILISQKTYALIQEHLETEELTEKPDFYRVIGLCSKPIAGTEKPWSEIEEYLSIIGNDLWEVVGRLDVLSPYLPAGVLPQLTHALQGGQITGQHRRVTVLFANFTGTSDIIHARGQDEAGIAADLNEYFQAMQEEVQYYGGGINKMDLYDQGDKLLVLFGAPVAHARDARRAALTALAMQEAMNRLSAPAAAELLSQRIGIHTGSVFAGNVGSAIHNRREYTVMGDTVNLAERIMSAAQPGQIWISEKVWEQIQDEFEAPPLPPIQAKGINDPITAYHLQGKRGAYDRARSRKLRSNLVGREAELKKLETYFDDLFPSGGMQIVGITGPAGVGKTRLVAEWRERVKSASQCNEEEAVTWLSARGRSYGQKTYGVFIEILEEFLAFSDNDSQEARWSKLSVQLRNTFEGARPGWLDKFSDSLAYLGNFLGLDMSKRQGLTERVEKLDAENLRIKIRLALCDLLARAAGEKSLVLLLDDLHWVDKASLDMLKFILDQLSGDTSLLFCLIFRQRKDSPIWSAWQEIACFYPDCHLISLKELKGREGRRLLSNLLKNKKLHKDFRELVLKEADGNPLYVEEILHTLIEQGILVKHKKKWRVTRSIEDIQVPDTLYQIVQSRIDGLDLGSPGARRVLWMAAAIGDEFAQNLLRDLFVSTGRKKREFWRHLRELRNANMILRDKDVVSPSGKPRRKYRFRHGLVRQVAYENMPVAKQHKYHLKIASWLKEKYGEHLQRHYDTLAHHYDQGGGWKEAFQYYWLAGQKDAQAYANQRAATHLRRALEVAKRVANGIDELAEVHFELGKVLTITGEFAEALEHLEKAFELFEKISGDTNARRARICYHIGRVYEVYDPDGDHKNLEQALEWQDKGLALLPETPTTEAAMLRALGGIIGIRQRDLERVDEESKLALSVAQQTGPRWVLGLAHRMSSISLRAQRRLEEALNHCQSSIKICKEQSDLVGQGKAYGGQSVIAWEIGDWPQAVKANLDAIEKLKQTGDKFHLAMQHCNLGGKYRCLGKLEQGFEYAERGMEIHTRIGVPLGITHAHSTLASLFWQRKELDQAQTHLSEARELVEKYEINELKPTVGRWWAQLHLSRGDLEQAEGEIGALLSEKWLGVEAEPIHCLQGQILAARGKQDEAIPVLQKSLEQSEKNKVRYDIGCASLTLAVVLAEIDNRDAEARSHAERAQAIFAELGAKFDLQEAEELIARL